MALKSELTKNQMSDLCGNGVVLHLFGWDKKFVMPFFDFVAEHFLIKEHRFIVHGAALNEDMPKDRGIVYFHNVLENLLRLMAEIRSARKVIIHGLFSSQLLYVLALQPWLLKKCYWTIWGGDLYVHEAERRDWRRHKNEWFRRFVISRLGHFITHIRGDYEFARQWYGASGHWHECFLYPSNIFHPSPVARKAHEGTNILLGNSASPTNYHIEALEKLRPFSGDNISIYCPLSYGDLGYADYVAKVGREFFGEKFIPLRKFISFDSYIDLLASIDIAIFNHKRQQAMGNITMLLGLGSRVYMRDNLTSWATLKNIGVDISAIDSFNSLETSVSSDNKYIIAGMFTVSNLIAGWHAIFKAS